MSFLQLGIAVPKNPGGERVRAGSMGQTAAALTYPRLYISSGL